MKKVALVSFVVLVATLGSTAARADDEEIAEARKQFRAGVSLLDDPDGAKYEEAYHAFKRAYGLSRNPKVLGNIAFCAMHLERDGEAIENYTAYLRDVPDVDERERQQIQRDLATLTSTGARVRIRVKHPGPSFQIIDTRLQTRGPAVENTYLVGGNETTLRVRPGRHAFRAKAGNVDSMTVEVQIEPATETTQEISFAAPSSGPKIVQESPSVAGPVILGITGLLTVGGGVTAGLLARDKERDIQRTCPNDLCPATFELDGQRDKAKMFGTMADAAFISGGVLVGGALLWYALLPSRVTKSPSSTTATAMCTGTGCAFQIMRGF